MLKFADLNFDFLWLHNFVNYEPERVGSLNISVGGSGVTCRFFLLAGQNHLIQYLNIISIILIVLKTKKISIF